MKEGASNHLFKYSTSLLSMSGTRSFCPKSEMSRTEVDYISKE